MKAALKLKSSPSKTCRSKTASAVPQSAQAKSSTALIKLRPYQEEAFLNRTNGIEVWLWGRQTGKSYTLAAWAVDRLVSRPGRLVTVLSNSRSNGMELNHKCGEICRQMQQVFEQEDLSGDHRFETMNLETRIRVGTHIGRIKILPANARTARGFSGDLILDEFAFHENSTAIWEAVEPILSANPDYLCRVASTSNGKHNMFYRLATDPAVPLRRVRRSEGYAQGLKIFHPVTREEITPGEAQQMAKDQRAYNQNYECEFGTENMALLTHELISAAERAGVGVICEQSWSHSDGGLPHHILSFLIPDSEGPPLFIGVDVGRHHDLTVITVLEKVGHNTIVRGILRIRDMRLPLQQEQLALVCKSPRVRRVHIDMTGLGLGLYEYSREQFGAKIHGINFSSSVVTSPGATGQRVRITEHLAMQLLQAFEDRQLSLPIDPILREDLRLPERVVTASGRVSIAATTTSEGHADHFWSLALALNAAKEERMEISHIEVIERPSLQYIPRDCFL